MDADELKWFAIMIIGILFGLGFMALATSDGRIEQEKTKQLELRLEIVKAGGNIK